METELNALERQPLVSMVYTTNTTQNPSYGTQTQKKNALVNKQI